MARNFARAVGVARFPIELVRGDVSNAADVERAIQGCQIVFHGAAASQTDRETARAVNVGGTQNVMAAALRAGVERVVHISSLTVYGFPADGDLDETAPRQYQGLSYADTKLDAETVAFDYHRTHGLPVSVIQPACVYGPFGGYWTKGVLDQLKNDRVILVDDGQGLANPVYVDDVIQALLLAAVEQEAVGEAFLISDGQRVTWRQFYEQYARLVDGAEIVSAPAADLIAAHTRQVKQNRRKGLRREAWNILRQDSQLRRRIFTTREGHFAAQVLKLLAPPSFRESFKAKNRQAEPAQQEQQTKRRQPPAMSPQIVRFYTPQAYVQIDKAQRLLGYRPTHTLETGLPLVEQWARWARML
jgi:nucleoside-diphosphate-sugar epimerase